MAADTIRPCPKFLLIAGFGLRERGMAGATVLRGVEGFGAHSRLHTSRILQLSEDLPMVIECADTAERIDDVLPLLDKMVSEGMVTLEPVEIIAYRAGEGPDRTTA